MFLGISVAPGHHGFIFRSTSEEIALIRLDLFVIVHTSPPQVIGDGGEAEGATGGSPHTPLG